MSQVDQLVEDVRVLVADLRAGLTNLHAQIASLKGDPADAQALQQIGHGITGLIERAQQGDALAHAVALLTTYNTTGSAPYVPPALDETAVPKPPETPETPAVPPKPRARRAASSASVDPEA
jgi:hypothetical protein